MKPFSCRSPEEIVGDEERFDGLRLDGSLDVFLAIKSSRRLTLEHRVEGFEPFDFTGRFRVRHLGNHSRVLQHFLQRVLEAGRSVDQHELALVVEQYFVVGLDGLLEHVFVELVFDEARRRHQDALDDVEVDVSDDSLHHSFIELGEALKHEKLLSALRLIVPSTNLLVLRRLILSLSRNRHVNLTPHNGHVRGDEADVCDSLLHDDSSNVSVLRDITCRIDPAERN